MSAPLVAVPVRAGERFEAPGAPGMPVQSLNSAYVKALQAAGLAPVLVPTGMSSEPAMSVVQGLVLPGGPDLDPQRYGEEVNGTLEVDRSSDELELGMLSLALERGLPILCICRGLQLLNVALGGTLVQDLESQRGHHPTSSAGRGELAHQLAVVPSSRLSAALGTTQLSVNSLHHQGIGRLAPGLTATARADDGLIEGAEISSGAWVVGVQFHPEELVGTEPSAQSLFQAFAEACRQTPGGETLDSPKRQPLAPVGSLRR